MGIVALKKSKYNDSVIKQKKIKVEKKGNLYTFSEKKTPGKQKGDKAYPLRTPQEITAVIEYYENKAISPDTKEENRWISDRNVLLMTFGFNVGIRASDIRNLRWSNVYDNDGEFLTPFNEETENRRTSNIVEKKTQKIKNLIFNDIVKEAFNDYVKKYNIDIHSDDYVFKSRQKNKKDGEYNLSVNQMSQVIKEAVKECGIKRRVASHTFRKTFAYFQIKSHQDDAMFTAELTDLLNQEDEESMLHYAGLDVERKIQYHDDVQLGKVSKIRNHKKIEVNHDKELIVNKDHMEFILKELTEKCYICNNDCKTCYYTKIAETYGYDLNTL